MDGRFSDQIRGSVQTRFGGLHRSPAAGDGDLYDMRNLTGALYPLLSTRQKRRVIGSLTAPGGLIDWGELAWVDGTGFYYGGQVKGTVTAGEKTLAAMGAYILIFPDKAYYNILTNEFGSLEARWTGSSLVFSDGTIYGVAAKANCITVPSGMGGEFRPGDAVTIAGCVTHPENNGTFILREVHADGGNDKLMFSEHAFTLAGEGGDEAYTETGTLTLARTVPNLRFVCENDNRLWGSDGQRIYASKLGDPFNFNVFDDLETDSWVWPADEAGIIGGITACVSFLGYPVFFQENKIYKIYGSAPRNYEAVGGAALGVMSGADRSLAIAGETLFYLGSAGFMAYSGGRPRSIGDAFGLERQRSAVGGSDGLRYYASMQDGSGGWLLGVYDPDRGTWHLEDETHAIAFARHEGNTYMLGAGGDLQTVGTPLGEPGTEEADFAWIAEFADNTEDNPDKKGLGRLLIRLELDEGASCTAWLRFDSSGEWIQAGETMPDGAKRSYILPVVPHRADHYRLKLTGQGGCRVYSIKREYYSGSGLKALPGRN